jgi:hypothetical protein
MAMEVLTLLNNIRPCCSYTTWVKMGFEDERLKKCI